MSNIEIARDVIRRVNEKFRDGCANQKTGPFDFGLNDRWARLSGTQRQAMEKGVADQWVWGIRVVNPQGQVIERVHTRKGTRAWATGEWLEKENTATVGNCGERSFLAAYLLRKANVPNVTILTGDSDRSINHDFVVIGATDIPEKAEYSQDLAPTWRGEDIVICETWYQAGEFSYECGIAYGLGKWPQWMPKVIAATLNGLSTETTLNRNQFTLEVMN